jgi:hypothetical protein
MAEPQFSLPPALAKMGLKRVVENTNRRLILSTSAHDKCGKTHFATTAPGPIFYLNTDQGDEGVLDKCIAQHKNKVIFKKDLFVPRGKKESKQAVYEKLWTEFIEVWEAVCDSGKFRTVVIDTGTDLWTLIRLARFGKLEQVRPENYAPVTAEFEEAMNLPKQYPTLNALYLHKKKKIYLEGKDGNGKRTSNFTGKYEPGGCSSMAYIVQVNLEHYRLDQQPDGSRPFGIRVVNNRLNPDCDGLELTSGDPDFGDQCSFKDLAMNIYPDTTERDWL